MLRYSDLLQVRSPEAEFIWNERDAILYALATGFGRDPVNPHELPFVLETAPLRVVPTFATVAAWNARPLPADMQLNLTKLLHSAQSVVLHRPLPARGRVLGSGRVSGAIDKGDKGALIFTETVLRDASSGVPIVTLLSTLVARGDGHFGGPTEGAEPRHPIPPRAPDIVADYPTRPDQALLYRLCGDHNPIHADPEAAARAGFARPILHGLCTFGITCRAVLEHVVNFDESRIKSHAGRFSSPIIPGDTLTVELWVDDDIVSFQAKVSDRDAVVLTAGRAKLAQ